MNIERINGDNSCWGETFQDYSECASPPEGKIQIQGIPACSSCIWDTVCDLRSDSMQDSLTGLSNERAMRYEFEQRATAGKPFGVLYIDVKNFKYINDEFSHLAGDYALQYVANILALGHRQKADLPPPLDSLAEESSDAIVRDSGQIHRKGGDEFFVFVSGPDMNQDILNKIGDRLQTNFQNLAWTEEYNSIVRNADKEMGFTVNTLMYNPANPISYDEMLEKVDPKVSKHESEDNYVVNLFRMAVNITRQEIQKRADRKKLPELAYKRRDIDTLD